MPGYSKFFNEMVRGCSCRDMIHPWTESCWSAFWQYMRNYSFEGVKFFAPAVFVSVWTEGWDRQKRLIVP